MASKDIRLMTITELGQLAEAIRIEPSGSRNYKRLRDQMCAASLYLEDSGALQQLLWWAKETVMEAPPEAKGKLFLMPSLQTARPTQAVGQ
jgi:hypothetical protein